MSSSESHDPGGSHPTFFKGSFLIFLLFLPAFLFIILTILIAMQYKQLRAFVSPQKVELVEIPISPEAEVKAVSRVSTFLSQGGHDTLSLSSDEINHLLRSSKSLSALHLDYHMDFQDTLLVARNSLPVDHLNGVLSLLAKTLHIKGYLNSEMKGYISLEKGKISLVPVSATMNGLAAPVSVLNRKGGGIDPAEWMEDKEAYNRALNLLSDIKVRDGSLLLIKKP